MKRPKELQERIGSEAARLAITIGSFVGNMFRDGPTFVRKDPQERERLRKEIEAAIETGRRVGGEWITIACGDHDPRMARPYQMANLIDNLKFCAEPAENARVTLLVEAINRRGFPNVFLSSVKDAYLVVRAVGSVAVKLVFDTAHVQIEDGDLIKNINQCWEEIAYFQLADNPGRCEPGTGEINFVNLLRHIDRKGYRGILDMEHLVKGQGREGEEAVIRTYRMLSDAVMADRAANTGKERPPH